MASYEYSDDYATCVETRSTLRIYSDNLHPDEITAALGLQPASSFAKGETFGEGTRQRKFTGWFFSSDKLVNSRDTRRHLDQILAIIDGKDAALESLAAKGCKLDIMSYWLSIGHGGPVIEPEQMTRLANLKLKVWWDVYFDRPDEDES